VNLPPGQSGRIQLRGGTIFRRYYNNEKASNAAMTTSGWFDTGDLGSIDDTGALRILGRSKETIIINGLKYASFELEAAIESGAPQAVTPSYTASFSTFATTAKVRALSFSSIQQKRSQKAL